MRFTRSATLAATCSRWRPLRILRNCLSKSWTSKRGGLRVRERSRFLTPPIGTRLMYVAERRAEAVRLAMPDVPAGWLAAGAIIQLMESMGGARMFSGNAESYDALVDAPIEAGKFEMFPLSGIKPQIWVVIHGDNWSKKQVEEDLGRICKYELKLMEGAPFERYMFILHIGKGAGSGGMEHANSTAIGTYSDEYLPSVAAHEFFHLWNVKRIRPASLEPVDDSKEQYTRVLWFAEGVTNTYGSYTLVRSGIWSKEQFYADLSEQITELEGRPANRWQSAEQSSLDAWQICWTF
ncbi:MAG: hypothetical protein DMG47_10015 [Acidobacteria bacterium]|nr:MAG: hypothetical protein DMG47_10015 [Acidobacteriota bacterium]